MLSLCQVPTRTFGNYSKPPISHNWTRQTKWAWWNIYRFLDPNWVMKILCCGCWRVKLSCCQVVRIASFQQNIVYDQNSVNYFVWMENMPWRGNRQSLRKRRDKVNRKLGMFPIHNDLREALIEAAIGRNGLKRPALTQILLEPKPVDHNSRLPEEIELEKSNFATELMKVYDTNSLFTPKLSFMSFWAV